MYSGPRPKRGGYPRIQGALASYRSLVGLYVEGAIDERTALADELLTLVTDWPNGAEQAARLMLTARATERRMLRHVLQGGDLFYGWEAERTRRDFTSASLAYDPRRVSAVVDAYRLLSALGLEDWTPLRQHRDRQHGELDQSAVVEIAGWAQQVALQARARLLSDSRLLEGHKDNPLCRFGELLWQYPEWGREAICKKARQVFREAYAADAPLEGFVTVQGVPISREVRTDPDTGKELDVDVYLPAGGDLPESLSPEKRLLEGG